MHKLSKNEIKERNALRVLIAIPIVVLGLGWLFFIFMVNKVEGCADDAIDRMYANAEVDSINENGGNRVTFDVMKIDCYKDVNTELLRILKEPKELEILLNLKSAEARLIAKIDRSATEKFKNRLILDLADKILDTIPLDFTKKCANTMQPVRGDLAVLSIYQIEEFPFALALRRQWCTGPSISDDMTNLPFNLLEYTHYDRENLRESYLKYLQDERVEYLEHRRSH